MCHHSLLLDALLGLFIFCFVNYFTYFVIEHQREIHKLQKKVKVLKGEHKLATEKLRKNSEGKLFSSFNFCKQFQFLSNNKIQKICIVFVQISDIIITGYLSTKQLDLDKGFKYLSWK